MNDFMNCRECVDLLLDYLEGALDSETQANLDDHFSACPPCVNFLETYRSSARSVAALRDQQVQVPLAMDLLGA